VTGDDEVGGGALAQRVATILIVGYDGGAAKALQRDLERARHSVRCLASGEAALAYFEAPDADLPDAVICELGMSGVSGVVVVESLRASERTSAIRIICTSSRLGMHDHALALEAGADAFVEKPIKLPALEATLARVLAGAT
jgi:DNA-binding response OmpR family regulator